MHDDPTGTTIIDRALKGLLYDGISTSNIWDASITQGPGISAGPANKRTYKLSKGTVRDYFDYLKKHGITYSINFAKKKKKKKPRWSYYKDKSDPDNLKFLGK